VATYKHIAKLIVKHRKNILTAREKEELEAWRNLSNDNQLLFSQLNNTEYVSEKLDELYSVNVNEEWGKIRQMFPHKRKKRIVTVLKYAAIVTGLFIGGIALFSNRKSKVAGATQTRKVENSLVPDNRQVTLKLANGRIVNLDSTENGHIALQYKSVIYKRDDLLRYEWSTGDAHPVPEYNTVTTPRARTYAVELCDGSKAWLNAASSITYPTVFTGNERVVQITGEVYFEVNPAPVSIDSGGRKKPFIVYINSSSGKGKGMRVEVMGTHFNVNAYDDEAAVKTTLLEGKVKVVNGQLAADSNRQSAFAKASADTSVILSPGQQAQVNNEGKLHVIKYADIQEVMAWHKNKFIFNDTDIRAIMQQIARQYDYTIVYKEPVDGHYSLSVSRQQQLEDVLEQLELAGGIHFEIEGKKIFVSQ
jgi:transmembrane sensor